MMIIKLENAPKQREKTTTMNCLDKKVVEMPKAGIECELLCYVGLFSMIHSKTWQSGLLLLFVLICARESLLARSL